MGRRVLVTGSREWTDSLAVAEAIDEHMQPGDVLVHGCCHKGADRIADSYWGFALGQEVERWPADWDEYGKAAGHIRNQKMVDSAPDLCLAFIRNESKGATGCAGRARMAGIPVVVYARFDY